jgi:hypothetical protein
METLVSTHGQCLVCKATLEQPSGEVVNDGKYCPNCSPPKVKSPRDTSAPEVIRNSQLLCSSW